MLCSIFFKKSNTDVAYQIGWANIVDPHQTAPAVCSSTSCFQEVYLKNLRDEVLEFLESLLIYETLELR